MELTLIGIASIKRSILTAIGVSLPLPSELIRSNGLLLPIAMIYCAGLVGMNTFLATWDAIKEPAKEQKAGKVEA